MDENRAGTPVELTTPARRRVELPRLLSRAEWSQLVPVERVNQLMTATFPLLAAWTGFQNPGINAWPFLGFGLAQSIALTWGRRFPAGTVVAVVLLDAASALVAGEPIVLGVIMSAYLAAAWGDRLQRAIAMTAGLAFGVVVTGMLAATRPALFPQGLIIVLGFVAFWLGGTPDELRPPPTLDQIEELVALIPEGGPRVTLERQGQVRPADTSIELAAYRVVQESLTNVAKHAGEVDTGVRLTYLPDSLEIEVHNALPGARRRRSTPGTGLVGMRERVELLGGTLHAGTNDDGGFTVYATLPLRQQTR